MISDTYVLCTYDLKNTTHRRGWMAMNGCRWMKGVGWTNVDKLWMKVNRHRIEIRQMLDEIAMDIKQNYDGRWMELQRNGMKRNGWRLWWMVTDNVIHIRELYNDGMQKKEFFFLLRVFKIFILFFFFFFFQSYYKGYSLHDCKLKNRQECIAQMLTSKPMYKESKCMWGCLT